MRIRNPLQMNDWEIKPFLYFVLVIQIAFLGLVGLTLVGLDIPALRQLISITFLFFIPGVIILRILKLHKSGNIETLLYSVGLSLALIMFAGALINFLYPLFGIASPISLIPLALTMSALVIILCCVCYVRDRHYSDSNYIDIKGMFSPPLLALLLLPFISVFGTYLVNFHHTNILLLVLIVSISVIVILIGFNKFFSVSIYPFAVFAIALSVLFHRTLITSYITGFDIHEEYYLANLVNTAGSWQQLTATFSIASSMLSLTILGPVTSILCDVSLTWVFKIIYPLILALACLGLYQMFRKQFDERTGFLASFIFVALQQFYFNLAVDLRQQIASLFFILLVSLIVAKARYGYKSIFLIAVFSAALVVSHYGLTLAYIFYIISAQLILLVLSIPFLQKVVNRALAKVAFTRDTSLSFKAPDRFNSMVTLGSIFTLVILTLVWYTFTAESVVLKGLVGLFSKIISNVGVTDPGASHGINLLRTLPEPSVLRLLNLGMNYLNQAILVLGVFVLLIKHRQMRFNKEYACFSVLSLIVIFANVFFPAFSLAISIDRLYFVTMLFLTPIFVVGGSAILGSIGRLVRVSLRQTAAIGLLSLYFAVFFLFQTGFVWHLTDGYSGSVSLSQEGIKKSDDIARKVSLYTAIVPEQEVFSARWLAQHREAGKKVYATYNDARVHALLSYSMIPVADTPKLKRGIDSIPSDAYVYLKYLNVVENTGTHYDPGFPWMQRHFIYDMAEVSHLYEGKNKIYSNGGSEIYR